MSMSLPELHVADHLVETWHLWLQLSDRFDSDDAEFCEKIHELQNMIAMRVARRANPEYWRQPRSGRRA